MPLAAVSGFAFSIARQALDGLGRERAGDDQLRHQGGGPGGAPPGGASPGGPEGGEPPAPPDGNGGNPAGVEQPAIPGMTFLPRQQTNPFQTPTTPDGEENPYGGRMRSRTPEEVTEAALEERGREFDRAAQSVLDRIDE